MSVIVSPLSTRSRWALHQPASSADTIGRGSPTTSSAFQPNSRSAAGFQRVVRPSRSTAVIGSGVASSSAWRSAFVSRSSAAARFCSVTSTMIPIEPLTRPSGP